MNTKYILLILLVSFQFTNTYIQFNYTYKVEVNDVCEKEVIESYDVYIRKTKFNTFYESLYSSDLYNSQKLADGFSQQKKLIESYIKALQEEADQMDRDSLDQQAKMFVISKINFIYKQMNAIIPAENEEIDYQNPLIFSGEQKTSVEYLQNQVSQNHEEFRNLQDDDFVTSLSTFVKELHPDNEEFQTQYFDHELCKLLNQLNPILRTYYDLSISRSQKDKQVYNNLYQLRLVFENYLSLWPYVKCPSQKNFRDEFLDFIFRPENRPESDIPNLGDLPIFFYVDDEDFDGDSKAIIQMDRNYLDLDNNLYDLNIDTILEYKDHPKHYSLEFMEYLNQFAKESEIKMKMKLGIQKSVKQKNLEKKFSGDDLEEKLQELEDDIEKKLNKTEKKAKDLQTYLYKLYIYARATDFIDDQFSTNTQDILNKLIELQLDDKFKKTSDEDLEDEFELKQSKLSKLDIRNNFLPMLKSTKATSQILKGKEGEVTPEKDEEQKRIKKAIVNFGLSSGIVSYIKENDDIFEEEDVDQFVTHSINENFNILQNQVEQKRTRSKPPKKYANLKEEEPSESEEQIFDIIIDSMDTVEGDKDMPVKQSEQVGDLFINNIETQDNGRLWNKKLLLFISRLEKKQYPKREDFLKMINLKLMEKIKSQIFFVNGYFKLLEYSLTRILPFFPETFDAKLDNFKFNEVVNYEEDKSQWTTQKDYQQQINNQKLLFNFDNFLYVNLVTKIEQQRRKNIIKEKAEQLGIELTEEQIQQELKLEDGGSHIRVSADKWFNKFHRKTANEFLEQDILQGDLLISRFQDFEFFFEMIEIFHLFDNVSIHTDELEDMYGNLFINIYRFLLDVREDMTEEVPSPIDFSIYQLEECINQTYEQQSENVKSLKCTLNYQQYMEMWYFFKYFQYQKSEKEQEDVEEFFSIKKDVQLVETSTFVIFISHYKDSLMDDLCTEKQAQESQESNEEDSDEDSVSNNIICMETRIFKNTIPYLNLKSFNQFYQNNLEMYIENFENNPMLIWSVLETIKKYSNQSFKKFVNMYEIDLAQNGNNSKQLLELLKVDESKQGLENYARYLKYNFAYYTIHQQRLQEAVRYIYLNDLVSSCLYVEEDYQLHGIPDHETHLHFRAIAPFLYFGHSLDNYRKLANLVKNKGWLIILFKNNDINYNTYISELSEIKWSNDDEEDYVAKNAEKLKEFLTVKQTKYTDNTVLTKVIKPKNEELSSVEKFNLEQEKKKAKRDKKANKNKVKEQVQIPNVPQLPQSDLAQKIGNKILIDSQAKLLKTQIQKQFVAEPILKTLNKKFKAKMELNLDDYMNLSEDEQSPEQIIESRQQRADVYLGEIDSNEQMEAQLMALSKIGFQMNQEDREHFKNQDLEKINQFLEKHIPMSKDMNEKTRAQIIEQITKDIDSEDPLTIQTVITNEIYPLAQEEDVLNKDAQDDTKAKDFRFIQLQIII